MTVTVASFRAAFPEFAQTSTTAYPDTEVGFWLGLSANLLDPGRWGAMLDYGTMLFMAHNLAIGFKSKADAASGQQAGQVTGALTAASVDKVSYGRDASAMMVTDAGHWNMTTYGIRYIQLVKMVGAGPIQVGLPGCGEGPVGAWYGPSYGGFMGGAW